MDESDVQVARFQGTFRHGYPFESGDEDEDSLGRVGLVPGLLQYLLHANSISLALSQYARPSVSPPVEEFLKAAFSFTDQAQGAGNATSVAVEVLSETNYEPPRLIKTYDYYAKSHEPDPFFDPTLEERCLRLVRPEHGWFLFNGDPTGRKKARHDRFLRCDPDALWLLHIVIPPPNPPPPRSRYVLTKYTTAGDLVYRLSFDELAPIYGFDGGLLIPSFRAQDGYLTFDWWDSHQGQRNEQLVRRAIKVRIAEPKPEAPK